MRKEGSMRMPEIDKPSFHLEEAHSGDPAGSGLLNVRTQQFEVPS